MKKGVKFLIFFILIALIWIIFLLLFKSRITGYSINAKNFYLVGENLEGFYNLKLRQGELWPLDAKVVVKANNITKELSLRDWLEQSGIDYEIIYGNFYVYDKNIYGYGEGFGKIGKYIEKPNIKFEIKIYSKEKEEKPIEEEHPVEIKPEIPVEQPTPIEQPQETVEQPQEEIPSQTEQPTEVEQPVEQPQLPPEEAETPAVPEQPSEQPEKPEAEKVQEGIFSRLIKYGPLNFFYLFRNLVGFAITNEIEGEKIIQAYVNIDNPYILEINENQYAEFVSGSVKINDIPADDNFIKFEKKDNKIIVTTDYKIEREGFGKEFLGEEFYINLSLNIFNLTFDKEGVYDLDVEIIYNNIILDKASAKIFVEKSNQTYYIIKLIDEKGRVIKEINISKNETREGIKLKIKEEKIILEKPEEIKVLSLIPFVKAQLPTSRLPVCGNNECESGEDTSNCPSDCPFTIYNYRGGDISVQFISPSQELINKGILTEIVYSTPADFDYALIKLNKIDPSLEISKILKCENWNAINTSCVGNFIPVDIPFVDYGDYIVINITNFSAYAGGAGYNASLVIWDSSDARAIGIKETIFFYANYSTYPDGIPINDSNGICLAFFSFENRPGFFSEMQFNYSSMLWETSFLTTEDMVGINNFTVNCSSSNYDNLTASDEFIIQNISVNIITNCTEINQSGIYKLNSNLTATLSSSFDGACIKIASDNVIFDCNNYAIINDLTDPTPYIITILKRTPSGLETGYNVSIKNCEIYNVYGNGIEINTFNNVNLENIKILKQERDYCWSLEVCGGIDIYDSNNISINNYYYEGSGVFGLRISNSSYLIARNIDIINYLYGYEIIGECIYANMLNNSIFDEGFLNCSINLRLNGGSNINISNFYITNSYVRVTGGNIIIENNTFEDIYSFGAIDFLDSENIFIRNNIFKNVKGEYIKVDSSNNFEIYNNTFYYNSSEGLFNIIYLSASNNGIIKDNKFIYDDFTDSSQPLNNSSFIGISNSNNEIIKFENNYFKWEENEFYFDALIINTTSIYAYKGSPPSSPNNLIPLNKSLIIYQYSYNNRIDLNISFDPIYSNISYYKIDLLNDSGWIQQYTEIINNKAYTYFETPALNETYVFLSLFGEAPAECTCNSCKDCMDKLNDPSCTEVKLINDIINHTGTCINNPSNFSNKVFDCQGYRIDGDDSGTDYGIYLHSKQNNT
ncbi:MAG: right-handed parallel beta-helix repeat-containing protein, partial [Candidatus Pacearchaeota archaeon]